MNNEISHEGSMTIINEEIIKKKGSIRRMKDQEDKKIDTD